MIGSRDTYYNCCSTCRRAALRFGPLCHSSMMADTGGDLSPPFSPFALFVLSPWAHGLSPPILCPLAAGAASLFLNNNHIEEALADPAFSHEGCQRNTEKEEGITQICT